MSEPTGDAWVVERLVEAARAAAQSGAPESAASFLRRVLAEPPSPDERHSLLLELGMAEASAGLPDWRTNLALAVDSASTRADAGAAAMVLALALSRAQHYAEAVEVLDRAIAARGRDETELGVLLEAAAIGAGMNGAVTAHTVAARREAARERAVTDPAAPPELLAVAAFSSALANEPAIVGAALARRAIAAGGVAPQPGGGRPWYSFATWFSQSTTVLLWAECYGELRPLLDRRLRRRAPPVTEAGSRSVSDIVAGSRSGAAT